MLSPLTFLCGLPRRCDERKRHNWLGPKESDPFLSWLNVRNVLSLDFALGPKVPEKQTKVSFLSLRLRLRVPERRAGFVWFRFAYLFYLIFCPGNHVEDMTHLQDLSGLTTSSTFLFFFFLNPVQF